MKKYLIMFVALLALSAGQANAQRCLPKMKGIELKANMADGFYSSDRDNSAGYSFGAVLSSYTKGGNKWVFGAEYLQWHSPYTVSYTHLTLPTKA